MLMAVAIAYKVCGLYSSREPLRMHLDNSGKGQTSSLFPLLREEGPTIVLPHSYNRTLGPAVMPLVVSGDCGLGAGLGAAGPHLGP